MSEKLLKYFPKTVFLTLISFLPEDKSIIHLSYIDRTISTFISSDKKRRVWKVLVFRKVKELISYFPKASIENSTRTKDFDFEEEKKEYGYYQKTILRLMYEKKKNWKKIYKSLVFFPELSKLKANLKKKIKVDFYNTNDLHYKVTPLPSLSPETPVYFIFKRTIQVDNGVITYVIKKKGKGNFWFGIQKTKMLYKGGKKKKLGTNPIKIGKSGCHCFEESKFKIQNTQNYTLAFRVGFHGKLFISIDRKPWQYFSEINETGRFTPFMMFDQNVEVEIIGKIPHKNIPFKLVKPKQATHLNFFEFIPIEVTIETLRFFTQKEIFQVIRKISKSMWELCNEEIIWKFLCENRLSLILQYYEKPDLQKQFDLLQSWKKVYFSMKLDVVENYKSFSVDLFIILRGTNRWILNTCIKKGEIKRFLFLKKGYLLFGLCDKNPSEEKNEIKGISSKLEGVRIKRTCLFEVRVDMIDNQISLNLDNKGWSFFFKIPEKIETVYPVLKLEGSIILYGEFLEKKVF